MSTEKLTMPQLGESVTEGTVSTWLVKEGDHVNKYDPIAEVMTDKVNAEVPSLFSGTIQELVAEEGETVQVGDLMCYIETEDAEASSEAASPTTEATSDQSATKDTDESADQSMKKRYSPAVLRLAQEHHIDLEQVTGTGRGGRITRKDVEKLIASGDLPQTGQEPASARTETETPAPDTAKEPPAASAQGVETASGDVEIPVKGVRKVIADNMVKSTTEIPHAWMTVEVDVTDLVTFRNQMKDTFKQNEGFSLTFFAFFVKAVAQGLKAYPQLNSMWAGDKIIRKKDIHISIAVASDDQLFVPVIPHADEKSIKGIAKDIVELAEKTRTGKLTADDMQGGTFTVNNTGTFGSIHSMGVINPPQAAILQVESIVKRPVIINDMFAARDMVNLSLSLDHRILDGLICGQFLQHVKANLENMNEQTTHIY